MTRVHRLMYFAAVLILTGCAATPPTGTTEVGIPVPVPCHAPVVEKPAFAVEALAIGAIILDQVKALLAERRQRQAYEAELEVAVKACQ